MNENLAQPHASPRPMTAAELAVLQLVARKLPATFGNLRPLLPAEPIERPVDPRVRAAIRAIASAE
jgi:hypothetical protein